MKRLMLPLAFFAILATDARFSPSAHAQMTLDARRVLQYCNDQRTLRRLGISPPARASLKGRLVRWVGRQPQTDCFIHTRRRTYRHTISYDRACRYHTGSTQWSVRQGRIVCAGRRAAPSPGRRRRLLPGGAIGRAWPPRRGQIAPNYWRYCRTYFPGTMVNRIRGTNEPACTRRGRVVNRINVGLACRLTTGRNAFRRIGRGQYICL